MSRCSAAQAALGLTFPICGGGGAMYRRGRSVPPVDDVGVCAFNDVGVRAFDNVGVCAFFGSV